MTTNYDSQDRGDFSDVLASDRVLDAIGRGERVESADPLLALLASAREQADRDLPAVPALADLLASDMPVADEPTTEAGSAGAGTPSSQEIDATPTAEPAAAATPLARGRGHLFKRGASAAAAGGVSITTMLIAGGVAAAIAVGGLGYAAYTATLPSNDRATTQAEDAPYSPSLGGQASAGASATGSAEQPNPTSSNQREERDETSPSQESESSSESASTSATGTAESAEAATLAEGLRSATQDPRLTGLPGYTPPPPVGGGEPAPLPNYDPDFGKFEEPAVPGLNRPMEERSARPMTLDTTDRQPSQSQTAPQADLREEPLTGHLFGQLDGPAGSTDTR